MRWLSLALGICAALGVLGAPPGLTWLDAGELGSSAWELGVAHPPGFPVFAQWTAAFMHLLPLGEVAWRGNLASLACAVAAMALVVATARALGASMSAAIGAALLLMAAPIFLLHARTIEVYAGAAVFVAAMSYCVVRLQAEGDPRYGLALALLAGLAAGHHAELRLFVLLLPMAAWPHWRPRRLWAPALGLGVLGASSVLWLPLRAATQPLRNWGDPSSLEGLWAHLVGARIRAAFASQFGQAELSDVAEYATQMALGQPLLFALGILGFVLCARTRGAWLLPAIWVVDAVYSVALNPMGLRDWQNGVCGLIALSIGAGLALHRLGERLPAAPWAPAAIALGLSLVWSPPSGAGGERGLPALTAVGLHAAPPEALVLVASDGAAASLAFAQVVEGARPDLAVLVRQHLWDASSVEPVRRRLPHALLGWKPGALLEDLAQLKGAWPLRWEWAAAIDSEKAPRLEARLPWFAPPGEGPTLQSEHAALLSDLGPEALQDRQARRAFAGLLSDEGLFRFGAGDAQGAVGPMARAAQMEPERASNWTNLGNVQAALRDYPGAVRSTRQALSLDPFARTARVNLVRFLMNLRQTAEASSELEILLADDPTDPDALGLSGVILANGGELEAARSAWEAALKRDPRQAEARAGLARLPPR